MSSNSYIEFEIFDIENDGNVKTNNINTLLGYPNVTTGTTSYRTLIKKYNADQWAGAVTDELVNACSDMSYEEKLQYYDDSDLKSMQWLNDNDWFEPCS